MEPQHAPSFQAVEPRLCRIRRRSPRCPRRSDRCGREVRVYDSHLPRLPDLFTSHPKPLPAPCRRPAARWSARRTARDGAALPVQRGCLRAESLRRALPHHARWKEAQVQRQPPIRCCGSSLCLDDHPEMISWACRSVPSVVASYGCSTSIAASHLCQLDACGSDVPIRHLVGPVRAGSINGVDPAAGLSSWMFGAPSASKRRFMQRGAYCAPLRRMLNL